MKRILLLAVAVCMMVAGGPLSLRAAEHNFNRWEPEIAAFEQMDRTNLQKGAVLFVGSSTIRMWKSLSRDFPQHPVINRGFGGSEIVDCTHFAERIIFPCEPRAIFLRSGGNDLNAGSPVEGVFADFKEFAAKVQARLPTTDIYYISFCPCPARWRDAEKTRALNALVAEYCKGKPHLVYIETYSMALDASGQPRTELFLEDKLHFNAEGYRLLAERVRPYFPK